MNNYILSNIAKTQLLFAFLMMLFPPGNAFAHLVNQDVGEFYAGMLHPLTSAEHLLPAVALALLAGWCGIQVARWTVVVFPLALIVGTWIGNSFVYPGYSHLANLIAIIILGVLLVVIRKLPLITVASLAAMMGLILGLRSGIDMADAGVGMQFIPGVALTGLIIITLISAWISHGLTNAVRIALRITGGIFILAGIYLLGSLVLGDGTPVSRSIGLPTEESLTDLVKRETLSLPVIVGAFMAATAWGASHALTPGHGKAIVGAYLIGSRGTPMHAVYLGLTVTATHTLGVFTVGLIALFASHYILADQLTPWLAAASGLVVIVIGALMCISRLRPTLQRNVHAKMDSHHHTEHDSSDKHDHDHAHTHKHNHDPQSHGHHPHIHPHLALGADGADVSWRSLLGLGISGGLLPCPSALVLLLTAISLERTGFGILLVIAFSFGLAGVLTVVGLLFIKGSRLLHGIPGTNAVRRYAPAFSAFVILIIGVVITVNAFMKISL
jgi:ABC-type nickel/cobalt efflux system permease component RcnA/hydrogenase/urease accessory protein HupE